MTADDKFSVTERKAPVWRRIEEMGNRLQGLGQLVAHAAKSGDREIKSTDTLSTLIESLQSHLLVLEQAEDVLNRLDDEYTLADAMSKPPRPTFHGLKPVPGAAGEPKGDEPPAGKEGPDGRQTP